MRHCFEVADSCVMRAHTRPHQRAQALAGGRPACRQAGVSDQRSHWLARGAPLRGQAIMEYAILFGIVTAALLGMQLYSKRGIQAGIKTMADRLSPHASDPDGELAQRDGIRYESRDRQDKVVASAGAVLDRTSRTRTVADQETKADVALNGSVQTTIVNDTTQTRGDLTEIGPGVSERGEVVFNVK